MTIQDLLLRSCSFFDTKIGNKIEINFFEKKLTAEVLRVNEFVKKEDAMNMSKIIN